MSAQTLNVWEDLRLVAVVHQTLQSS